MEIQANDLLLRPTNERQVYNPNNTNKNVHWGQLKLFFAELAFLNYYYDPKVHKNPVVIYIGAASGIHLRPLIQMFSTIIRWILYDPNPFELITEGIEGIEGKVSIYNEFFDDVKATNLKKQLLAYDIFLISDIRTADYKTQSAMDYSLGILKDNTAQIGWVNILDPVYAHLKFRFPYPDKYSQQYVEFYDGIIHKQAWAPPNSTESRLVINKADIARGKITYDIKLYEEQFAYFNNVVRPSEYSLNGAKFPDEVTKSLDSELINDFDSMMSLLLIRDYLVKINQNIEFQNIIAYYQWILENINYKRDFKRTISFGRKNLISEDDN